MVRKKEAIKKSGINKLKFRIYILVVIVLAISGVLLYNSLKTPISEPEEKVAEKPFWNVSEEPEESIEPEEHIWPEGEKEAKPTRDITSGGSGGGGGGGSGGGSSGGGAPVEYTTDLTICTNAQNSGICNGLDIAYGDGYESACCSERGLCC